MKKLNNERGSVLVFITLMIVLLIIMAGMGMDTGVLTFTRATGQGAVDAAALSAVSALPNRIQAEVESRAIAFNGANNYTNSGDNPILTTNVSYIAYDFTSNTITSYNEPFATANGVRVALEGADAMKTPLFLTPLFNLLGLSMPTTSNVSVSAVSVVSARPSIPIALWNTQCDGTKTKPGVKIRQQNPGEENSCWTCYLDSSCGARDVKDLFKDAKECQGSAAAIGVGTGTKIYENKGQQASDYDLAYEFFFETYPDREWLIPVIAGGTNCNEKNPTAILDWAKIKVTEIKKNGAHSYIQAEVTCGHDLNKNPEHSVCHNHRLVREPSKGM